MTALVLVKSRCPSSIIRSTRPGVPTATELPARSTFAWRLTWSLLRPPPCAASTTGFTLHAFWISASAAKACSAEAQMTRVRTHFAGADCLVSLWRAGSLQLGRADRAVTGMQGANHSSEGCTSLISSGESRLAFASALQAMASLRDAQALSSAALASPAGRANDPPRLSAFFLFLFLLFFAAADKAGLSASTLLGVAEASAITPPSLFLRFFLGIFAVSGWTASLSSSSALVRPSRRLFFLRLPAGVDEGSSVTFAGRGAQLPSRSSSPPALETGAMT
mmetsp:Transcript_151056/g.266617  ORF Transcript_151056/g.266617 Transcript_151056/m.266617 type:complete len:279 (+) Transcript_151056:212-1048(+)